MEQEVVGLSSLPVPCVQELAKESMITIPPRYIRTDQDQPLISDAIQTLEVPVIDMQELLCEDSMDSELDRLHFASKEWGFFQIITNGAYRSIEHRATVNSAKERLSIAIFCSPGYDGDIGPASSLITEQAPALFRRVTAKEYIRGYLARELRGKSYLDVMTHENPTW